MCQFLKHCDFKDILRLPYTGDDVMVMFLKLGGKTIYNFISVSYFLLQSDVLYFKMKIGFVFSFLVYELENNQNMKER